MFVAVCAVLCVFVCIFVLVVCVCTYDMHTVVCGAALYVAVLR